MTEHEHSYLLLVRILIRSLNLLTLQTLVDPIADVLGEQLPLFAPEPLHLCLILGWSGERGQRIQVFDDLGRLGFLDGHGLRKLIIRMKASLTGEAARKRPWPFPGS